MKRGEKGKWKERGTSLPRRSQNLPAAAQHALVLSRTARFCSWDTSHGNILKNTQDIKELLLPLRQAPNAEGEKWSLGTRNDAAQESGRLAFPSPLRKDKSRRVPPRCAGTDPSLSNPTSLCSHLITRRAHLTSHLRQEAFISCVAFLCNYTPCLV